VDLLGTWTYKGDQANPPATLNGTLTITSQSGQDFTGTLDVTQTDVSGSHPLSGPVTGRALDATSVDFDVFFTADPAARRHLGTVKMDSLTNGTWVESGPSGPIATGSFKSARQSGP